MNATIAGVLFAVIALGVVLAVWGRRGRKVNNHPQCRDCGFDLEGVYPASVTCPECGSGLKRPGAVRNGVRKRMAWVTVLGLLIALLPLAPMAVLVYAAVTGTNIARYTPTGILLWQTRISSPAVNKTIADELISRLEKKELDKSQSGMVADRVLAMQADKTLEWDEMWGNVIDRINLNGDLSKQQLDKFRQQAVTLSGRTRAAVRPGDALPLVIKAGPGRVASNSQMLAFATVDSAKLDDQALRKPSARGGALFNAMAGSGGELYFYVYGGKANSGWMGGAAGEQEQVSALAIPKDAKPGMRTLTVTVLCKVSDAQMGWGGARLKATDPGVSTVTISQQVEVLAEGTDPIKRVTPTPAAEKDLRALLKQTAVTANVAASGGLFPIFGGGLNVNRSITAQLTVDKAPTPFAFDVFVRLRDKETRIGEIASAPTASGIAGRGYSPYGGANTMFYFAAEVPNLQRSDKKLDLIFRPSSKVAMSTTDLSEIYGGEIVLKDFPVTRYGASGSSTSEPAESEPETSPEP